MDWKEILKLVGPFILELFQIIFKSPKQATENLKSRGLIVDHKDK